jgi:predicted ATP-grasp superfamily ATP-dependent carboligase
LLLERRRLTDAAGGRFLGPTPEAIALCGDKLRLCEHLSRHSLPTIPTTRCDFFAKRVENSFPIVVKPRDGAGSVNTFLIRDAAEFEARREELAASFDRRHPLTPGPSPARGERRALPSLAQLLKRPAACESSPLSPCGRGVGGEGAPGHSSTIAHSHSEAIVQQFIPGRPLSTAALIDGEGGRIDLFPIGEQRLTTDGRFSYRGGRIPAIDFSPQLAAAAVELVTGACRSIPGLAGFVGFDLIASTEPPHVRIVEINPRLTTSYVGYRRLTRENLAARMLTLVGWAKAGSPAAGPPNPESKKWWASARDASSAHPTICATQFVEFDADGTVRVS